jgi:hypothetical protein
VSEKSLKVPIMTPRLKARLEFHKARLPPFLPLFNRVFVWPIREDAKDEVASTVAGPDGKEVKILRPQLNNTKLNAQRGILVAAGMKAMEYLYSHGINLGDYVITQRLSPWERAYVDRDTKREQSVMILFAPDVTASEDLLTAHENGDVWFEMNEAGEIHLETREGPRARKETEDPEDGV